MSWKKWVLGGLGLLSLGLMGCTVPQLCILNTNTEAMGQALTDFSGLQGYHFTYANPASGDYRIQLHEEYVEGTSETHEETYEEVKPGKNNNEIKKRFVTTYTPPKVVQHYVNVHLQQVGDDVVLTPSCSRNDAAQNTACNPGEAKGFMRYLQNKGYTVTLTEVEQ